MVSASVDLKAWIRDGGRSWMNPIVSEMRISWPFVYSFPTLVSNVAKSSSAT